MIRPGWLTRPNKRGTCTVTTQTPNGCGVAPGEPARRRQRRLGTLLIAKDMDGESVRSANYADTVAASEQVAWTVDEVFGDLEAKF